MKKLREILRNWLFRKEISDLNRLLTYKEQARQYIEEARSCYQNASQSYHMAHELITRCLDVGIDHNIKSPSWAVICIKGKPETVRFMQLEAQSAQELREFLKHLQGGDVIFDSPFSKEFFNL
jgi:hypothetical protein